MQVINLVDDEDKRDVARFICWITQTRILLAPAMTIDALSFRNE